MFDHAIEADGLVKDYGEVRALDGLDLEVQAGTVFGLLGPNGAGKSTTVRILTTLSRATAGSARVAGFDVAREALGVRRAIGVVGQKHGCDLEATGRENLVLQGELYGMADVRRRADELLDRFELPGKRQAKTYSGGMQRRLDVALGLIHHPQVLFLDEPTTGLDPEARAELWEEIGRLTREHGLTILLTTHYLEEADRLASRLAIVDHGRVVAAGTPDDLKAELHGDAVQVELAQPDAGRRSIEVLARVPGVREPVLDGRRVRANADRGAAAVPSVVSALEAAGIGIASVTVARPSLDDVYLRHTGRDYRNANGESYA
ncbi:MAG TPA: ATP-binding cassette domain-containing protein [Candidatus Limnocylindria bacterium]|nr:ATP-binding cassette domain-containing protein [Candidatus Limnocylindria bacterium]